MIQFIQRNDNPEIPPPYKFPGITIMSFQLPAKRKSLQALCDDMLNIGSLSDRGFDRHELMLPWLHWQVALRMASLADDPLGRYWPVVMPDTMPEVRDGATVTGAQH